MAERAYQVLFVGTGNAARSIIAEAFLNAAGKGRFHAWSAGLRPAGVVHPLAIELLVQQRIETTPLRPKGWEEFARSDAPGLDFVFTVCDVAADEPGLRLPGDPVRAHWGVADPATPSGSDEMRRRRFFQAYNVLANRIRLLLSLPIDKLDRLTLQRRVAYIGSEGA